MKRSKHQEPDRNFLVIHDRLILQAANDNSLPWRKKWRMIGAGLLILLTLLWAILGL